MRATRQYLAVQDTTCVRSELLCYVFNKYSSDTHDAIYSAVSEFYGSESVEDAKQLLWQSYSSHLGTYPQHKGKKAKENNLRDIMSSLKIIDRKFSGALPIEFYALMLENLPSFKVDNVALKIQKLEKMLRDIPTRTEVQSIVVLNSRPAGSRPNHASILSDKGISTPTPDDATITAPMPSHAGDNQSDLNTLIGLCAEPEVGPSEASTSSVLDESISDKLDSPLHTPCLIDLDCDITIKTMVIPETQLDTSTSDFLASLPTGIMPSTPERCVSRGSRSGSRSPPPLNLMDEQSQQHKSGSSTPELFSQIVSSNDMPTSGKWSLKKRKSARSGMVRSQFVKNTKKGRTLVVGSNKNTSLMSNRRFHIFVTLNTDDECVAQYIKNQPIISSCELINTIIDYCIIYIIL